MATQYVTKIAVPVFRQLTYADLPRRLKEWLDADHGLVPRLEIVSAHCRGNPLECLRQK